MAFKAYTTINEGATIMYKGIETFASKYKHSPTLQTGKTPHGDSIYRCNGCGTVAFVTKNNDVYGYGTKTICSRPSLTLADATNSLLSIDVEVTEHPQSTMLYHLPDPADLPVLLAQLASNAASFGHKMEPSEPHPAFPNRTVDGMRCSVCKAPITGGFHTSRTIDDEPSEYVLVVAAWRLNEVCRGYSLDRLGNKVYPTPEFPAKYECVLSLTGEAIDLCYDHAAALGTHILKRVPLEHPTECQYCINRQRNIASDAANASTD